MTGKGMDLLRRLKIRHLRGILAVDEQRSFTRAADALSLSQPALSKVMLECEEIIGQPLFERRGHQLERTAAGQALVRHARVVIAEFQACENELQQTRAGTTAQLNLGSLPAAVAWLVPHCVARFKTSHPNVVVQLHEGRLVELVPRLVEAEIELLVGRLAHLPDEQEALVERTLLYEDPLVVVGRPGHPLAKAAYGAADPTTVSWIVPTPGSTLRARVEEGFASLGVPLPLQRIESDSLLFDMELASESDAVFFMTGSAARLWSQRGRVAVLPVRIPVETGAIGVLRRKRGVLSSHAAAFIEVLTSAVRTVSERRVQAESR